MDDKFDAAKIADALIAGGAATISLNTSGAGGGPFGYPMTVGGNGSGGISGESFTGATGYGCGITAGQGLSGSAPPTVTRVVDISDCDKLPRVFIEGFQYVSVGDLRNYLIKQGYTVMEIGEAST